MKRSFVVIGSGLFVGMFVCSQLDYAVQNRLVLVCLGLLALSLFFYKRCPALPCFCGCLVLGSFLMFTQEVAYQSVIRYADTTQTISGEVTAIQQTDSDSYRYWIEVEEPFSGGVLLFMDEVLELDAGDQLTATVTLSMPSNTTFNLTQYYKTQGIDLYGWSVDTTSITVIAVDALRPLFWINQLNSRLSTRLNEVLTSDAAAVINSMVLGNRDDLDSVLVQQYINAGAYHLFSVSGLHLSILMMALYGLLTPLVGRRRSGSFIIWILLFFLLLSGVHLSTLRSFLMVCILLIGRTFHQKADALNSLFLAGSIILLCNCYAVLDVSFLLSFCSTFGLLYFLPKLLSYSPPYWRYRPLMWLHNTALFCVAVSLPLLPIYAFVFGYLASTTLLSNLLVVPLATVVLLLSFLLCCLVLFCTPTPLIFALELLINLQNRLTAWIASLPFNSIGLDYPAVQVAVVLILLICALCPLVRRQFYRRALLLCGVAMGLGCILFATATLMLTNRLYVVGDGSHSNLVFLYQGQCTVISTADDSYIDELTLDFLKGKGVDRIDNLLLTYDEWQYYEDSRLLVSSIAVGQVWLHRDNVIAQLYFEGLDGVSVRSIDGTLRIEHTDFVLDAYYVGDSLGVNVELDGMPIAIGSPTVAQTDFACLYFITGANSYTEFVSPETTWLLSSPYSSIEADIAYAYEQFTSFRVEENAIIISLD